MALKPIEYGTYKKILSQGRRTAELPDTYYEKIPQSMRRIAFTASGIHRMTTIQDILNSLEVAERNNLTFEEWSQAFNIDEFQQLSDARKQVVFRTNMATQYNNGRLQVGFNSDRLTYLKYQAILDDRTRPNHAANDGITRPINDPFWATNTPPLGFNCRCIVLNLGKNDLEENPPTPDAVLDNKGLQPDPGFNFDKKDAEKSLDQLFRQRAGELPTTIRRAAIQRFLRKNQDLASWWEESKKDFEKPKNVE